MLSKKATATMIIAILFLSSISLNSDDVKASHSGSGRTNDGDCRLAASMSIHPVYYNMSSRNNPDRTYYAGDAFHYVIIYGLKVVGPAVCRNLETSLETSGDLSLTGHTVEDDESVKNFQKIVEQECRGAAERGLSCRYGHAEVSIGARPGDHYLKFKIEVEHRHCSIVDGELRCSWHKHEAEAQHRVNVLKPNIYLDVVKTNVTDSDGYWERNLDQTYYLWDAINVLHLVKYKWQNERVGTLHTTTTKIYDLDVEKEFECRSGGCSYTLIHSGLSPWNYRFDYGSGSTVYNATSAEDYGKHRFKLSA